MSTYKFRRLKKTDNLAMSQRAKHWCFTINNPKKHYRDLDNVKNWTYMIVGNEVGENGTPHLQGYVCFENQIYGRNVKRQMPRAHIEMMLGTPSQAAEYCRKDGDYMELGEEPEHKGAKGGKATQAKYKRTIELAKKRDLEAIERECPDLYLRHYGTIKRIGMDNPPAVNDQEELKHEWIMGIPGIGKSRMARHENPGYYLKSHNKWWNGYINQEVALIDDLDKDTSKWIGQFLKNWADHYPFQAETKGDNMYIRPKKIVVTSNYTIEELWSYDPVLVEALKRRFKIRHLVNPWSKPTPPPPVTIVTVADTEEEAVDEADEESLDLDEFYKDDFLAAAYDKIAAQDIFEDPFFDSPIFKDADFYL